MAQIIFSPSDPIPSYPSVHSPKKNSLSGSKACPQKTACTCSQAPPPFSTWSSCWQQQLAHTGCWHQIRLFHKRILPSRLQHTTTTTIRGGRGWQMSGCDSQYWAPALTALAERNICTNRLGKAIYKQGIVLITDDRWLGAFCVLFCPYQALPSHHMPLFLYGIVLMV
jgi:hypothetical protein